MPLVFPHVAGVMSDISAVVLVGSGVLKIFNPTPWVRSIRVLISPPRRVHAVLRPAARTLGLAEIGIGTSAVLATGTATVAALAMVYLVFTAVAAFAASTSKPCGCFGAGESATSTSHVVLNALAAAAAGVTAFSPTPFFDRVDRSVAVGTGYLLLLAVAAAALTTLLTIGNDLSRLTRTARSRPSTTAPTSGHRGAHQHA